MLPENNPRVSTVFFGGGTPTLLGPAHLGDILRKIDDAFGLDSDAEVTVEANPETVDQASLERLRAQGVSRISFGMQSSQPHVLASSIASTSRAARSAVPAGRGRRGSSTSPWT